jgi:hypothetical protein
MLRFRDLNLCEDSKLSIGGRNYYIAQQGALSFVVSLCGAQTSFLHSKSLPPCFVLTPVAEFTEVIPSKLVSSDRNDSAQQGTFQLCIIILSLNIKHSRVIHINRS